LEILPDQAILEIGPGEIEQYVVVGVSDEFTVDLMANACGKPYADAEKLIEFRDHLKVRIPFASPAL